MTETLRFHAESYLVDHKLKIENRQAVAQSAEVVLTWAAPIEAPKDTPERFQGQHPIRVVRVADGSVHRRSSPRAPSSADPASGSASRASGT